MGRRKQRKKKKKKRKAKINRTKSFDIPEQPNDPTPAQNVTQTTDDSTETEVEVEYVTPEIKIEETDQNIEKTTEIKRIFSTFVTPEELFTSSTPGEEEPDESNYSSGSDSDSDMEDDDFPKPSQVKVVKSKKQLRKENRMSIAELKYSVDHPELVEDHDCNSHEPMLLIEIKSLPCTIPVAKHWKNPKKYLSSKRGENKAPFQLPEYIRDTGIEEIRQAVIAKNRRKTARQRMRERMDPKLGKNDLDYQVLYDAFFKYQTKPPLTKIGRVYREGQESNEKVRHLAPGKLSKKLKQALGMPEGAPPPWLINMQRFGPPPSYPWLKIPGVNAPLPPGAKWGYHPGGYGAPPRDSDGKLLYKAVFIVDDDDDDGDTGFWGEMKEKDDESDEEEEFDVEKIIRDVNMGSDDEEIEDEGESSDDDDDDVREISKDEMERERKKVMPAPPLRKREAPPPPPSLRKNGGGDDDVGRKKPAPPPPPPPRQEEKKDIRKRRDDREDFYRVVKQRERDIDSDTLVESTYQYDLKDGERVRERDGERGNENDDSEKAAGDKRKRKWDSGRDKKKRRFKW